METTIVYSILEITLNPKRKISAHEAVVVLGGAGSYSPSRTDNPVLVIFGDVGDLGYAYTSTLVITYQNLQLGLLSREKAIAFLVSGFVYGGFCRAIMPDTLPS